MKFSLGMLVSNRPDPAQEERKRVAEERIHVLNDEIRNQQQALQSGSRRLRTMARTMALLRDGIDG